jgi:hypothetical protein
VTFSFTSCGGIVLPRWPFYGGTVTFVDGEGGEHEVTAGRFSELFDRGSPLVKSGWRLKLRHGRDPIPFNGMLASLLRWAREERLLGGQRDRWQDKFRVMFRNYAAHLEYQRETPDDAAAEILQTAVRPEWIIWTTCTSRPATAQRAPIKRSVIA